VNLEQGDRLIVPFEHGEDDRSRLLPTEELLYFLDVLVRYRSKPHVLGNRIAPHGSHSNIKRDWCQSGAHLTSNERLS
jgi:hypothetical protein